MLPAAKASHRLFVSRIHNKMETSNAFYRHDATGADSIGCTLQCRVVSGECCPIGTP